jgi:hypothetical protein
MGMGGMNMNQLMAQARKMQESMAQAQEKSKELRHESSVGGGMVKVVATGDGRLESISIDPEALDPDDIEMLQDMILTAANDALTGATEAASSQMAEMTGLGNMANMAGLGGLF